MSLGIRVARRWLPLAVAISLLSGLVYVAVQQSYRTSADDPQVQIAADAAAALSAGEPLATVVGTPTVDIAASLAPFVIVFDASGSPVAGSARLDGSLPSPPKGALDHARTRTENRVTWQPRRGVRIASVSRAVEGGGGQVVLVGRSLRETEDRVRLLTLMVAVGWLATLALTLAAAVGAELLWPTRA